MEARARAAAGHICSPNARSWAAGLRASRTLAIAGLLIVALGAALSAVPVTREVWVPRSERLLKEVTVPPRVVWLWYPQHHWSLEPASYVHVPEGSRSLRVSGTVRELRGRPFDLHVLDRPNYELWKAGAAYTAYLEVANVSTYSLSLPAADLLLVVSNVRAGERAADSLVDEVVRLVGWADYGYTFTNLPVMLEDSVAVVSGSARELRGRSFDLMVVDTANYDLWKSGLPCRAFYEARGESSYSFSIASTTRDLYFIVLRTWREPGTLGEELEVLLSASISYTKPVEISVLYDVSVSWEERSYVRAPVSPVLGMGLVALGAVLAIASIAVERAFEKRWAARNPEGPSVDEPRRP